MSILESTVPLIFGVYLSLGGDEHPDGSPDVLTRALGRFIVLLTLVELVD